MEVLIGILVLAGVGIAAIAGFKSHTISLEKYNWTPFNIANTGLMCLVWLLALLGFVLMPENGDTGNLNTIVSWVVGLITTLFVLIRSIVKSSVIIGVYATLLQFIAAPIIIILITSAFKFAQDVLDRLKR